MRPRRARCTAPPERRDVATIPDTVARHARDTTRRHPHDGVPRSPHGGRARRGHCKSPSTARPRSRGRTDSHARASVDDGCKSGAHTTVQKPTRPFHERRAHSFHSSRQKRRSTFGGIGYNGIAPSFLADNAGAAGGFVFNAAIVSTATPATAPVGAFGAGYPIADIRDLGAQWRANADMNVQLRFIATIRGSIPLVGVFAESGTRPLAISQFFVTGTYQVACLRLPP